MDSAIFLNASQMFPIPKRSSTPIPSNSLMASSNGRQLDSSEEPPSFHDSLYDAKAETICLPSPVKDENRRFSMENDFLYGKGTVLTPIKEKLSSTTIGTKIGIPAAGFGGLARRKKSFSTSDVSLTYSTPVHFRYAQPKSPIREPLSRPSTPPGLPSWDEYQTRPRNVVSPRPKLLRRLFHNTAMAPSPVMARFRAPRSSYSGLSQHPFNRPDKARTVVSEPYHALPEHIAYIPPPSYTLPKKLKRRCTHKSILLAPPASRCSTFERLVEDSPPVTTLLTNTHLMSGGICAPNSPSPAFGASSSLVLENQSRQPKQRCWKCAFKNTADKVEQCWARSMMCMTCFGADYEEDGAETNVAEVVMMRPGSSLGGRVVSISR
ncbi:hypothetical protein BJ878DRAFT_123259 [Calycina marina]|uniref:Uncharacterized protein n=1 Tax=Calycina marina TaxID=1763456 RepID=A0A9P7Z9M2_9HELO|nr:hypothetical protein BJ878DRAFT_123259 [Calycina marina]